jgi:hypothetical protein
MNAVITILIFVINVGASTRITAMHNDEQLIQETNHIFDQACKDFKIDPASLALKVSLHEGKSIYGSAQTIAKKVHIERGRNASSAAVQFNMYHEVAHIADHTLACYQKVIKPMLITGTAALLYGIGALHYRYMQSSGDSKIACAKNAVATVLALGAGGLAIGLRTFSQSWNIIVCSAHHALMENEDLILLIPRLNQR